MNIPFCFTETHSVLSSQDAITEQLDYEFQTALKTFLPTAQINTYSSKELFYYYRYITLLYFTQEHIFKLLILYTLHCHRLFSMSRPSRSP